MIRLQKKMEEMAVKRPYEISSCGIFVLCCSVIASTAAASTGGG